MILTDHSVFARAGQDAAPGKSFGYLVMCIEHTLANKLSIVQRTQHVLAPYYYACIFENSTTCGESGVHQFIGGLDFANPILVAGYPTKMTPIKAWLYITLDEYDDLRIRRKGWEGKFQNKHAFPEYTRLEVRVRPQEPV